MDIIFRNQVQLLPVQSLISLFAIITSVGTNYMAVFLNIRKTPERLPVEFTFVGVIALGKQLLVNAPEASWQS